MPKVERFQVSPTVTVPGTPYSQFDVVGGLLTFTGLRGGRLRGITLVDKASQSSVDYLLVLFESAPTTIADNATYDIADADLAKIIFQRDITGHDTFWERHDFSGAFGGVQIFTDNCYFYQYGLDYPLWSAGGSIYGFLIVRSGNVPTYAATTDVTVSLLVEMGG